MNKEDRLGTTAGRANFRVIFAAYSYVFNLVASNYLVEVAHRKSGKRSKVTCCRAMPTSMGHASVFRVLLLVGAVFVGLSSLADETSTHEGCFDIDAQNHCTQLGELSESVLLAGTIDSCATTENQISLGVAEDPDSSVVFQFDLRRPTDVTLDMHGLGSALMVKQDVAVFRADRNVDSVNIRVESGRYTLIGRAPPCANGELDRSWMYKIRVDLDRTESSTSVKTVVRPQEAIAPTRIETRGKFSIGRWLMVGTMSFVLFLLLIVVLT